MLPTRDIYKTKYSIVKQLDSNKDVKKKKVVNKKMGKSIPRKCKQEQ